MSQVVACHGERMPRYRVPAVLNGRLSYLDLEQFRGQWVVLCIVVPRLGRMETFFLSQQAGLFAREATRLLVVAPGKDALLHSWLQDLGDTHVPIVADTVGRLRRRIVNPSVHLPTTSHSLVIDSAGHLRFRLAHNLNVYATYELLKFVRPKIEEELSVP